MADSNAWDWEKAARSFGISLLGGFSEPSAEMSGVAPNPIGSQPTGVQPTGEPITDNAQTQDKTLLYVVIGVVLLLVVLLFLWAVKG